MLRWGHGLKLPGRGTSCVVPGVDKNLLAHLYEWVEIHKVQLTRTEVLGKQSYIKTSGVEITYGGVYGSGIFRPRVRSVSRYGAPLKLGSFR